MAVDLKVRVQLEKTIGESLRLKPWEAIEKVRFSDDKLVALLSVAEVQETTREVRVKRSGSRMIEWTRVERYFTTDTGVKIPLPAIWKITADETFWNESAPEAVHVKWGERKTPEQLAEQREWEKMCHRPGTASTPLDNYDRVLNFKSTEKMERYW